MCVRVCVRAPRACTYNMVVHMLLRANIYVYEYVPVCSVSVELRPLGSKFAEQPSIRVVGPPVACYGNFNACLIIE